MTGRESAGAIYTASKPALDGALLHYRQAVEEIVRPVAGEHYVSGRVKAARSLIRKLRKDGAVRGWDSITDKVGLRVVCSTKRDRKAAAAALEQFGWTQCKREDKTAPTAGLAYTGIHVTVGDGTQIDSLGGEILCEIQVRTRAQDAWSVVSHKLLYKGLVKPPRRVQRVIWRLSVLAEIFDDDVQRMFKKRESLPHYELARAVEYLDDRYEALLGEPGDAPVDLGIIEVLWSAYNEAERPQFRGLIEQFLGARPRLAEELQVHQPDSAHYIESRDWLSTQPEVLAVLERATCDEHRLMDAVRDTDLEDIVRKTCTAYGIVLA